MSVQLALSEFIRQITKAMTMPSEKQAPSHIDLAYVRPSEVADTQMSALQDMLGEQEQERANKFRHRRTRKLFIVAHALQRCVLANTLDLAPSELTFRLGPHGKPLLANKSHEKTDFNLSHTHDFALCGVTPHGDLGVDVEHIERKTEVNALAGRFFAPSEAEAVRNSKTSRDTFFRFWTLKEAYIKATGTGLSTPLADFSYALSLDEYPRISFIDEKYGPTSDWHFREIHFASGFQLAVALRSPSGSLEIDFSHCFPGDNPDFQPCKLVAAPPGWFVSDIPSVKSNR